MVIPDAPSARDRRLFANRVGTGMSFDELGEMFNLTSRRCRQIFKWVAKREVENVARAIWMHQVVDKRFSITVPMIREAQTPKLRYLAWVLSELNGVGDEDGPLGEFVIQSYEVGDATVFEFTDLQFETDSAQEGA